jgi:hypothetical protein
MNCRGAHATSFLSEEYDFPSETITGASKQLSRACKMLTYCKQKALIVRAGNMNYPVLVPGLPLIPCRILRRTETGI